LLLIARVRGSQFTSEQFQRLMADQGMVCLLDEPFGQRLGQCGDVELLLLAENGAHSAQNLSDLARTDLTLLRPDMGRPDNQMTPRERRRACATYMKSHPINRTDDWPDLIPAEFLEMSFEDQLACIEEHRRKAEVRWPRLSEQLFRIDKWSVCRG
jgi:hypothetical protein